jgi:hypothetical protein
MPGLCLVNRADYLLKPILFSSPSAGPRLMDDRIVLQTLILSELATVKNSNVSTGSLFRGMGRHLIGAKTGQPLKYRDELSCTDGFVRSDVLIAVTGENEEGDIIVLSGIITVAHRAIAFINRHTMIGKVHQRVRLPTLVQYLDSTFQEEIEFL